MPAIAQIERENQGSPWSEQAFLNELTHPASVFLVGSLGNRIVAYGGMWKVVDEAHITTLMVLPELRGRGFGLKLMYELLNRAALSGMTCSTLEVRAGNTPAIQLYEKLGYARVAVRKGYYPDNKEDAVIMWLYNLDSSQN